MQVFSLYFSRYFFQVFLAINLVPIFGQSSLPLKYFTRIVPFCIIFITSHAVYLSCSVFVSPVHVICYELQVDGPTISNVNNVWSNDIWYLNSLNTYIAVVEYVFLFLSLLACKSLVPTITGVCWAYSWIYQFARSFKSVFILLGQFMCVCNLSAWYQVN